MVRPAVYTYQALPLANLLDLLNSLSIAIDLQYREEVTEYIGLTEAVVDPFIRLQTIYSRYKYSSSPTSPPTHPDKEYRLLRTLLRNRQSTPKFLHSLSHQHHLKSRLDLHKHHSAEPLLFAS